MKKEKNNPYQTGYIQLNTNKCKACWKCIESCSMNVFGKIDFWIHKHVKVKYPDNCIGCFKCINSCEFMAITSYAAPKKEEYCNAAD